MEKVRNMIQLGVTVLTQLNDIETHRQIDTQNLICLCKKKQKTI